MRAPTGRPQQWVPELSFRRIEGHYHHQQNERGCVQQDLALIEGEPDTMQVRIQLGGQRSWIDAVRVPRNAPMTSALGRGSRGDDLVSRTITTEPGLPGSIFTCLRKMPPSGQMMVSKTKLERT